MAGRGLVIFDLDGTLFRAESVTVPAVRRIFALRGLTAPPEYQIRYYIGRPPAEFHQWLATFCPAETAAQVCEAVDRAEIVLVREKGRLYGGALDALKALREEAEQMGLFTNGPPPYVEAVLEAHGLRPYFDAIRWRESPEDTKAGMAGEMLARLSARPAVVIGDRMDDVQAAHAHGLPAIGALYGMGVSGELAAAEATAHSPCDLPRLVREVFRRRQKAQERLSYKAAGVDLEEADAAKRAMARSLGGGPGRIGAFAALYEAHFRGYTEPMLVLKTEEPGSKQLIAFAHGRVRSICYDTINHLINDIAVMGARPLAVQDAIICGKLHKEVVAKIVESLADACRAQDCVLAGGETSEQPGVLEEGAYVLVASVVGVVEKSQAVDGSRIAPGDRVLAVASNGLHTNGYALVRRLMAERPGVAEVRIEGESFLDVILRPHKGYYQALRGLFDRPELHGMAHITGGGIAANLRRILPRRLNAVIDLGAVRILPIFGLIRGVGNVEDAEMLRTFNLGVGLAVVAEPGAVGDIQRHLANRGCESYAVGQIVGGGGEVELRGELSW